MSSWRIIRSFVLPLIVLVLVPWAIHVWLGPLIFAKPFAVFSGVVLMLTGLSFLGWTNVLFVVYGEGTLAPWDAPSKFVVLGPYRYVRNPMIIAVVTTIWGESMVFGSFYIFGWSLVFLFINHLWFTYVEEPMLEKKFGDVYERYKAEVPRWFPLDHPVEFEP